MTRSSDDSPPAEIDALLSEMIVQQRAKVLRIAREIDPRLTDDDVLSPMDFPALSGDARFNYEDGLLAGLLSAQIAARAHFRKKES